MLPVMLKGFVADVTKLVTSIPIPDAVILFEVSVPPTVPARVSSNFTPSSAFEIVHVFNVILGSSQNKLPIAKVALSPGWTP